jgi:hypothetical protein
MAAVKGEYLVKARRFSGKGRLQLSSDLSWDSLQLHMNVFISLLDPRDLFLINVTDTELEKTFGNASGALIKCSCPCDCACPRRSHEDTRRRAAIMNLTLDRFQIAVRKLNHVVKALFDLR